MNRLGFEFEISDTNRLVFYHLRQRQLVLFMITASNQLTPENNWRSLRPHLSAKPASGIHRSWA